MAERTAIEWTDATFNPWQGCTKVSPGCDHCYAEARMDKRLHVVQWGAGAPRKRTSAANWREPLKWNAEPFKECSGCGWRGEFSQSYVDGAALDGGGVHICPRCNSMLLRPARRRVFCASLADVFDNEVPDAWRADLFALIADTPNLDWLLLTKRIGNAKRMINAATLQLKREGWRESPWPWENVWLGATVVNQEEADRDIPKLLATPARVRFLSMEPLLGPVDLSEHLKPVCCGNPLVDDGGEYLGARETVLSCCGCPDPSPLDWVIVGGESGHGARPLHSELVRMLRDQCAAAGVPFLFKQWGEFLPGDADCDDPVWPDVSESRLFWIDGTKWDRHDGQRPGVSICARVGKKAAGRLLDGVEHNGFPEVA